MTYEEAKMQIQAIPEKIWDQLSEPDREAMEMASSALESEWEEMIVICDNCGHAIHVKKVVGNVESRNN